MHYRLFDANARFQYRNLEDVELSKHRDSYFAHWLHEHVSYGILKVFLVNYIIYILSFFNLTFLSIRFMQMGDKQLIRVFVRYLTGHLEMSDILKDIIRMVINFELISTTTLDAQHIVECVLKGVCGLRKSLIIME